MVFRLSSSLSHTRWSSRLYYLNITLVVQKVSAKHCKNNINLCIDVIKWRSIYSDRHQWSSVDIK